MTMPNVPIKRQTKSSTVVRAPITLDDLPLWMRPRRRAMDWGVIIVLAFAVLNLVPMVTRAGLPRDNRAILYAYRAVQVAEMVRAGVIYSRWAPQSNYWYGSPIFNYLPPLAHLLPGFHQAITEADPSDSVKLGFALAILAAGTGMYYFVRGRWGTEAGVLAAVCYLYNPALLLTLPYVVGDLALLLALGVLPWCWWACDRLWKMPTQRFVILAVASIALLILSEPRIAIVTLPVSVLVLITGAERGQRSRWRTVIWVILTALSLTAFYWLPAIAEAGAVTWRGVNAEPLAGRVTVNTLFAAVPGYDPLLLNPTPGISLGGSTWLITIVATLGATVQIRRRKARADSILFVFSGIGAAALATAPIFSNPITSFMPILPYHVLLAAIVSLAVFSGQLVGWLVLLPKWWRAFAFGGSLLIPLVTALPLIMPTPVPMVTTKIDLLTMLEDELPGYHQATLREGVLLLSQITVLPAPSPRLIESIQQRTFNRVTRRDLTADIRFDPIEETPLQGLYSLITDRKAEIELYLLNFPGWQATLDNVPLPLIETDSGLLTIQASRGRGTVLVTFTRTPARDWSWAITLVGVIMWGLLLRVAERVPVLEPHPAVLGRGKLLAVTVLLAVWIAVTTGFRLNPELLNAASISVEMTPLRRLLQGGVDLLGYSLPQTTLQAGQLFPVVTFWQPSRPLSANYQAVIDLLDSDGAVVATSASRNIGRIPSLRWPLNRTVRDLQYLPIPSGLPTGEYRLRIQVGPCTTLQFAPCSSIVPVDASDSFGRIERDGVILPLKLAWRRPN